MLTKKDVFDTIVGAAIAFGCMYAGYYAGRKKARWEEMGFDDRMDRLESKIYDIENWMNHEQTEEEALE